MLEKLKERQPQFYKQAIAPIEKGQISHAYFIETNGNDEKTIQDYTRLFCKQLFLHGRGESSELSKEKLTHLLEIQNFPDMIEIFPINNTIKKEQLLYIKEIFQEKSVYNTYQIYVVYQSEKLNINAANTILKFLEEPEENIIGLFLGTNRYNVINTILSRCCILTLKQEVNDLNIEDFSPTLMSFIQNILEKNKNPLMLHYKQYHDELFQTKENSVRNLEQILLIFKATWNSNLNLDDYFNVTLQQLSMESNLKIIDILENSLSRLSYNVNLKLWLDELLLNLAEVS